MSLVNNIDKAFQDNIAQNYEGLSFNEKGVFIALNGLSIPLLDKDCKVIDNRLAELSSPIRTELSGQYSDSPSLMKAFVARAQQELNNFFIQLARSWMDSLKAKVASENKILSIYEQRHMMDFLQDQSFKTKSHTKEAELDNYVLTLGINSKVSYDADPEVKMLVQELANCKERHQSVFQAFNSFLTLMKDMVELTKKVKSAANADATLKDNALKNLSLVNEITYEDMQSLPTHIAGMDVQLQKKLLTSILSKADFLQALK